MTLITPPFARVTRTSDPLRSTTLAMLKEAQNRGIAVSLDASSTGAIAVSDSGMSSHPVPGVDKVVDTTGAGDAFAAGYLVTRYVNDGSEQAAIAAGHKLSARH